MCVCMRVQEKGRWRLTIQGTIEPQIYFTWLVQNLYNRELLLKSLDYYLIKILSSFLRGKATHWSLQWFCMATATFRQAVSPPGAFSAHHSLLPQIKLTPFCYYLLEYKE